MLLIIEKLLFIMYLFLCVGMYEPNYIKIFKSKKISDQGL